MNSRDLRNLTIVSNFAPGPAPNMPRPPAPPRPPGPNWPKHPKRPGPSTPSGPPTGHLPRPPFAPGPQPERGPVRSPERYLGGVNYFQGQLVYLTFGDIFQATVDFRSSWRAPSLSGNLRKDIQSGYLVAVPATISRELSRALRSFEAQVDAIRRRMESMENEFDASRIQRFLIPFNHAFGTDTPDFNDAAAYLRTLDPPVEPGQGIFFRNTNPDADTFKHIFTFWPRPNRPHELILVDESSDLVIRGQVVEDVNIESLEEGGFRVTTTRRQLESGETTITDEDFPWATLDDIKAIIEQLDDKVPRDIAGEDGTIIMSTELRTREVTQMGSNGPERHVNLELVKTHLSLMDGATHTTTDIIRPVDWCVYTMQEVDEKLASIIDTLDGKLSAQHVPNPLIKSATVSGNGDGLAVQLVFQSIVDGTLSTTDAAITLAQMGAASGADMTGMSDDISAIIAVLDHMRDNGVQVQTL